MIRSSNSCEDRPWITRSVTRQQNNWTSHYKQNQKVLFVVAQVGFWKKTDIWKIANLIISLTTSWNYCNVKEASGSTVSFKVIIKTKILKPVLTYYPRTNATDTLIEFVSLKYVNCVPVSNWISFQEFIFWLNLKDCLFIYLKVWYLWASYYDIFAWAFMLMFWVLRILQSRNLNDVNS